MRKKVLFVGVALLGFAIPHQAWADVALTHSPSTPGWGTAVTFTATDGGSGVWTLSGSGCSWSGTGDATRTVNASKPTTCVVTDTAGGVTATDSVIFGKKAQTGFAFPAVTGTILSGAKLSTSGGQGTGAVSYTVTAGSNGACTRLVGSTLFPLTLASGTCTVTATKAADDNYLAASVAGTVITFAKNTQAPVAISNPVKTLGDSQALTLTASGGSGTRTMNYSVSGSGPCTVNLTSGVVASMANGSSCSFKVTSLADATYLVAESPVVTFKWVSTTQPTFTVAAASDEGPAGTPIALTASGGAGSNTVTYSVSGANCVINADDSSVVATAATKCKVTATSAASGFKDAKATTTVTFTLLDQAALLYTAPSPAHLVPTLLTVTGGSGSGALSYKATGNGCSVSKTGVVNASKATTCSVTVTKAKDATYKAASVTHTITFS